jgi:NDP-sugar pyrophosphorylase family protein
VKTEANHPHPPSHSGWAPPSPASGRGVLSIDAAILAGGLGTRIKGVLGNCPKVLAPVGERIFLDILLDHLLRAGIGRAVLCLGHLAEKVIEHLAAAPPPLAVEMVIEDEPLGTAGALRLARPWLNSNPVLVLNGDSWTDADLAAFANAHSASGAMASLLCVEVPDCGRYGRVEVGIDGRLVRYVEKDPDFHGPGAISAGIYLFSQGLLEELMRRPGPSLERDILQQLPPGQVHAFIAKGARFIDIGTPESLKEAKEVIT